jgi:hypothetical protein
MNVPLRVYALVLDLHMARILEVFYPDDLVRFGIAMDLRAVSSGFRMRDVLVPACLICWY